MKFEPMVSEVARSVGITRAQAESAIELFLSIVRDRAWQDREVQLRDFGTFFVKRVMGRRHHSPRDLSKVIEIGPHEVIRFRPTKNWRRR